MHSWISRTAIAGITVGIGLTSLTPAFASGGGDDVRRSGSCSRAADWKLKAKPDDGRLEVEGEVDSNRNGQLWTWRILHDGQVAVRGRATTHAPSGSFSVERRLVNTPGADRIGWRSHNAATGETCSGSLTI
jgi:hypothetical protein